MALTGSAQVTIPTDVMHTFEASHNKITWHLVVGGDIPRWPDVNDEYPLRLLPMRVGAPITASGASEEVSA